jgi:hypothetical protein
MLLEKVIRDDLRIERERERDLIGARALWRRIGGKRCCGWLFFLFFFLKF